MIKYFSLFIFFPSISAFIISNFVNSLIALEPDVSISLARIKPSQIEISPLTALKNKIMIKGSSTYFLAIFFVICSIFFG